MKIVFFGTPDYVVPIVDKLHREFKNSVESPIVAVVTQSPKPSGRDKKMTYSPVDTWAHKHKIPVYFQSKDIIASKTIADLGILASYSEFLKDEVINYFKYGIINVHPSALPEFRGSSPVQATIVTNSTPAVSFIRLDNKLDHGPILSQIKDELLPDDTSASLRDRLFNRAAEILPGLLIAYTKGKAVSVGQNHEKATFTREIKKDDGFVSGDIIETLLKSQLKSANLEIKFVKKEGGYFIEPTVSNFLLFMRAMNPWPGVWTFVNLEQSAKSKVQRRLKILKAHSEELKPNTFCLVVDLVQLEGKNPVTWKQFIAGYPEAVFTKNP